MSAEITHDHWLSVEPPLDAENIELLLPHRAPMLMLEGIDRLDRNTSIGAFNDLDPADEVFKGHFPQYPVFPGVLQLEAIAQASACLAILSDPHQFWKKALLLMSMDKVKFRAGAFPGSRLHLESEVLRIRGPIWKFTGRALVEGKVTTECELLATVTEMPQAAG